MRILLLDRFFGGRDGPGVYLYELSKSLLARGHRVALAYGKEVGSYAPPGVERLWVPGLHEDLWGRPSTRRALATALASFRPEAAIVQCLDVLWFAPALREVCPVVAALHTHALTCPNWQRIFWRDRSLCDRDFGPACAWHNFADRCGPAKPQAITANMARTAAARYFAREVDAFQAVSPYMRQTLERAGIPREKLFDLAYPAPGWDDARSYEAPRRPLLLFVGRLHPTKGPEFLLEAAAQLSVPCELALVGGGPQEAELRARAEALGLAGRVTFYTGQETVLTREALSGLYLDAAAVVVPSIWGDPAPLVRLEAMAHGRPLVVFDAGGVASCVVEGETGFVVPRLDVGALAERVGRLLSDAGLRERLGRRALEVAGREYRPGPLAASLERVLEGLRARRGG